MDILDRILVRIRNEANYTDLTQEQLFAFTDLLAMSMAIDRHIATQERDAITQLVARFDWPQGKPSEHIINQSVRRAWDILESTAEARQDYCIELGRTLKTPWLKALAYESCIRIIYADGHIAQPEQELIALLRLALQIDDAQAQTLEAKASAPVQP